MTCASNNMHPLSGGHKLKRSEKSKIILEEKHENGQAKNLQKNKFKIIASRAIKKRSSDRIQFIIRSAESNFNFIGGFEFKLPQFVLICRVYSACVPVVTRRTLLAEG